MSDFFNRKAELIIGNSKWTYPELEIGYDISFDADPEIDISTISISNLSASSMASISRGQPIILNAGYGNDLGSIMSGVISSVASEKSRTTKKLNIKCINVNNQYLNSSVYKSYKSNVKASFILSDMSNLTGVKLNKVELAQDTIYKRGFVAKGKVSDIYKRIASDCKSQLLIKNTIIEIIKPSHGYETGYKLTSDTGLIGVEKIDNSENQANYKVTMFLNHDISTKSLLQIDSNLFKGIAMVVKGSHNDWRTVVEVVAVG